MICAAAALCCRLGAGGQKPATSAGVRTAHDVLVQVLRAEERVPFSARRTVVLANGDEAEATVTDELNYGQSRSRILYAMPAKAHGRSVIRDGKRRWTIEPEMRAVFESEVVHRPITPAQASKIAEQVERSYDLSLGPGAPVVAGRKSVVLNLVPKRKDRQRRIWWVDRETGLVLRREQYGIDGALEQTTAFSNLQVGASLNRAAIRPNIPAGYKVVHRPPDNAVTSLGAAKKLLREFGDIPASLGSGFDFQSASLVDAHGARSLQVQYSDGLTGISLFKIPSRMTFTGTSGGSTRLVAVGSTQGRLMDSVAPYRVLTWEASGATYNLVSDIADDTMIRIAGAVRF